jgi:hypothetical protein
MSEHNSADAREFTRIPIKMEVTVTAGGKTVTSRDIKDVSMNGIFLFSDGKLGEGSECDIAMLVGEPGSQLEINAKGKIERETANGMAVSFSEIGLESYEHLHNLVLYNSRDATQIEEEFRQHLGLKRRE